LIASKKASDSILSIITAAKAAFTNCKHVTLYLIDNSMQFFFSNMHKRNYKDVPCDGVPKGSIMGIYLNEDDFCAPAFMDLEKAHQFVFT
jgi:hypothetical protein